jgi:uncharacterized protein YndB with AHSA1/START domain
MVELTFERKPRTVIEEERSMNAGDEHAGRERDADAALFAEHPTDRAIVVEREIDAPVADIWRVWTTNEGFQEVYDRETNIELRVGGPFEIFWDSENRIGSNGCKILSFSPRRSIAFSWNAPPSIPSIRERRTVVAVTLEPIGKSGTRMRLVNDGYGDGADWDEAFAYFEAAWPRVVDRIAEHFGGGAGASNLR